MFVSKQTTASAMRISDWTSEVCSSELRSHDYPLQFTGPTGANSVEAALKLARKVTGRHGIVAFTNGFHGVTLGALYCTGNSHHRGGAGVPLEGVTRMPYDGFLEDGADGQIGRASCRERVCQYV